MMMLFASLHMHSAPQNKIVKTNANTLATKNSMQNKQHHLQTQACKFLVFFFIISQRVMHIQELPALGDQFRRHNKTFRQTSITAQLVFGQVLQWVSVVTINM